MGPQPCLTALLRIISGVVIILALPPQLQAQKELFSVKWKNQAINLAFAPDGRTVAVALAHLDVRPRDPNEIPQVWVYDIATGKRVAQLKAVTARLFMGYRHDGTLVTCSDLPTGKGLAYAPVVRRWDVRKGEELYQLRLPARSERDWGPTVLSPRGDLIADWAGGMVTFFDTKAGKKTGGIPHPDRALAMCLSPKADRVCVVDSMRHATVFGVAKGERLAQFSVKECSRQPGPRVFLGARVLFSPKGDEVLYRSYDDGWFTRFDALTGKMLGAIIKPGGMARDQAIVMAPCCAYHKGGKAVIVVPRFFPLAQIDLASAKVTAHGRFVPPDSNYVGAMSPDGEMVAGAGSHGFRVWRVSPDPKPEP